MIRIRVRPNYGGFGMGYGSGMGLGWGNRWGIQNRLTKQQLRAEKQKNSLRLQYERALWQERLRNVQLQTAAQSGFGFGIPAAGASAFGLGGFGVGGALGGAFPFANPMFGSGLGMGMGMGMGVGFGPFSPFNQQSIF